MTTYFYVDRSGTEYSPVFVGAQTDWGEGEGPDYRCGDCGAKAGSAHIHGCDNERCPVCHGQLLMCSCVVPEDNTERCVVSSGDVVFDYNEQAFAVVQGVRAHHRMVILQYLNNADDRVVSYGYINDCCDTLGG